MIEFLCFIFKFFAGLILLLAGFLAGVYYNEKFHQEKENGKGFMDK